MCWLPAAQPRPAPNVSLSIRGMQTPDPKRSHTKMDSMHIIHYTLDEHYNQDGELVES